MPRKKGTPAPDSVLTLRRAYELHYDRSDLRPGTLEVFEFELRRWEKLTPNLPVSEITDESLEAFRQAVIASGAAPPTVNRARRAIRAILRRIGPRETRNPAAKGILPSVPYMKPCREVHSAPRRLELDDEISRFYLACRIMESPRLGFPPEFWWQGLCCWLFCTGMRLRDALSVRFADIDCGRRIVRFTARKTRKADDLPLHPVVIEHVERIRTEREFVFQSARFLASGEFHQAWRKICEHAKLAIPFTPHDLRRTAASEINRAAAAMKLPPLASVLLQHSSRSVTDASYANQTAELREALTAMRMPLAFKHGPKEAERQLAKAQQLGAELMRNARFAPPTFPDPAEWSFAPTAFAIRGCWIKTSGGALRVMQALATSPQRACTLEDLAAVVWPDGYRPERFESLQGAICDRISKLRERLRRALHLPDLYDPIPNVERGKGGKWTIFLPAQVKGGAA